jgi:hypothetical protein
VGGSEALRFGTLCTAVAVVEVVELDEEMDRVERVVAGLGDSDGNVDHSTMDDLGCCGRRVLLRPCCTKEETGT